MNIWVQAFLFAVGIVLIVKGGDAFVDAASWIAEISGIPKFIVGATIVSLATTLPELIVSLMAAGQGKVEMAVGNAVGSVTANTGLILSIALIFLSVSVRRKDYLLKSLLLIGAAAVLPLASLGGSLALWGSLLLVAIFAVFVWENVRSARRDMGAQPENRPAHDKRTTLKMATLFVLGAAAIVGGSQLLVSSGSAIAAFFGVPERIVAVTLVAVGTSLPELVTTVTAIIKKQASLSVGNIIGANLIDMTLILPLCAAVSGKALPISAASLAVDMPVCLLLIAVALVPMLFRQKFSRWQGALMLCLYAGYLVITI